MKKLRKDLDSGKNVAIACYCPKYKRDVCHLSILGGVAGRLRVQVEEVED